MVVECVERVRVPEVDQRLEGLGREVLGESTQDSVKVLHIGCGAKRDNSQDPVLDTLVHKLGSC